MHIYIHKLGLILRSSRLLILAYVANLFLSFHYFTTAYVNSTFLGNFFPTYFISASYILAALVNIFVLFIGPAILNRYGNYRFIMFSILIDLFAVIGLTNATGPTTALLFFLIHQTFVTIIAYNLDIFLERNIKSETHTGELRGVFLTMSNIAVVLSPLLLASLRIQNNDFSNVYMLSSIFLIPLIFIVISAMRNIADPLYHQFRFIDAISTFYHSKNIGSVFVGKFLLELVYVWMIIYVPLFLINMVGFTFNQYALMLSIALLPFLFFELPIGFLADNFWGEKEMMMVGFFILTGFIFLIPQITLPIFWFAAVIMFMVRVGSVMVEMTTESYFFKKMNGVDADMIGVYRMARPLSYCVGPLIAIPLFYYLPNGAAFYALSFVMLSGLYFVSHIEDTR